MLDAANLSVTRVYEDLPGWFQAADNVHHHSHVAHMGHRDFEPGGCIETRIPALRDATFRLAGGGCFLRWYMTFQPLSDALALKDNSKEAAFSLGENRVRRTRLFPRGN